VQHPQLPALAGNHPAVSHGHVRGKAFVHALAAALNSTLGNVGQTVEYIEPVVPADTGVAGLQELVRDIQNDAVDFLVLLGKSSAHTLLETTEGILKLRGRWRPYDTGKRTIQALPTLHPAYLLRQPLQKRYAWRDFLMLKAAMGWDLT